MFKNEFLKKLKAEKLNTGEYIIVVDYITDEPLVMGCAQENGVWKIYETKQRGGKYILKELTDEHEAFDYFYQLLLSRHNYLTQNNHDNSRKS
ncbi:hypothetical protein [Bacillus sp. Au-Bac7]|uniref:hypothetical protein n=1 Tax=Bacillus sp. Au-Bac7 TaxID=2906458 RepID=UPI001E352E90|nr:hypothetical protein [Bacillus sp. Au-Bac7]MCE4048979.1 hypothetical protein [Bacillus sp. Au-Bac7]